MKYSFKTFISNVDFNPLNSLCQGVISSDDALSRPVYPKQVAGQTLFRDLTVLEYRTKPADNKTLIEGENIPIYIRFLDKFRQ